MSKPRATVARKNSLADNRKKPWAEPDSEGNHLPLVGTGFSPMHWVSFESSHVGMRSLVFHHGLKVKSLISCMGSFGLQKSCHPVWQTVIELEVIGDGMEGHLAAIPKLLQILRLGPPSFLFHSSPDMLEYSFLETVLAIPEGPWSSSPWETS